MKMNLKINLKRRRLDHSSSLKSNSNTRIPTLSSDYLQAKRSNLSFYFLVQKLLNSWPICTEIRTPKPAYFHLR
jgi:hypothetical protein